MRRGPFGYLYADTGGIPLGPHPDVSAGRTELVAMLLFAAFYVYAWQRTYPPGS